MRTSSDASQIKRRTFLKYKATVGMIGVLGAWGISRTKIMWQVNKIMALASLGGKAEQANTTPFSGTELAVAFSNNLQQYARYCQLEGRFAEFVRIYAILGVCQQPLRLRYIRASAFLLKLLATPSGSIFDSRSVFGMSRNCWQHAAWR